MLQELITKEVSELLDYDFTNYSFKSKKLGSFIEEFTELIETTSEKEKYKLNAIKLCKALESIQDIKKEHFKKYKILVELAHKAKSQEDYNIISAEIFELGDKVIKENFQKRVKQDKQVNWFCLENRLTAEDLKKIRKGEFFYEDKLNKELPFDDDILISYLPEPKNKLRKEKINSFLKNITEILSKESDFLLYDEKIIITSYAMRAKKLDKILSELTKDFCAEKCPVAPLGCCDYETYYQIGMPTEMLKLQEKEAKKNGWLYFPVHCKYHTNKGCKLKLYKPPICLGYICSPLNYFLNDNFSGKDSDSFLDNSRELTDSSKLFYSGNAIPFSTYFKQVFELMDNIIKAGENITKNKTIPKNTISE